jgi:hypothetical protein
MAVFNTACMASRSFLRLLIEIFSWQSGGAAGFEREFDSNTHCQGPPDDSDSSGTI